MFVGRIQEQNPSAYPAGQGEAAVQRIIQRLAMGISLLDDPEELAERIQAISQSSNFNPGLYAVSSLILSPVNIAYCRRPKVSS